MRSAHIGCLTGTARPGVILACKNAGRPWCRADFGTRAARPVGVTRPLGGGSLEVAPVEVSSVGHFVLVTEIVTELVLLALELALVSVYHRRFDGNRAWVCRGTD